jgi:hypothetical protein
MDLCEEVQGTMVRKIGCTVAGRLVQGRHAVISSIFLSIAYYFLVMI